MYLPLLRSQLTHLHPAEAEGQPELLTLPTQEGLARHDARARSMSARAVEKEGGCALRQPPVRVFFFFFKRILSQTCLTGLARV